MRFFIKLIRRGWWNKSSITLTGVLSTVLVIFVMKVIVMVCVL